MKKDDLQSGVVNRDNFRLTPVIQSSYLFFNWCVLNVSSKETMLYNEKLFSRWTKLANWISVGMCILAIATPTLFAVLKIGSTSVLLSGVFLGILGSICLYWYLNALITAKLAKYCRFKREYLDLQDTYSLLGDCSVFEELLQKTDAIDTIDFVTKDLVKCLCIIKTLQRDDKDNLEMEILKGWVKRLHTAFIPFGVVRDPWDFYWDLAVAR